MFNFKNTIKSFALAIPGFLVFLFFLILAQQLHRLDFFNTLPFPPVISGMILFLIFLIALSALNTGIPFAITRSSDFFLPLLPLFILPSCVGVLKHQNLLINDGIKIILAIAFGLIITIFCTPFIFTFALKLFPEKH